MVLKSVAEARLFFHRNEKPINFVSATPFNLLGIDVWVSNFKFINYIDCFDGRHPNVFVPGRGETPDFESIEDINNYLLAHEEVLDYVSGRGRGLAAFLMFDEETEALVKKAGLQSAFPKARLRNRLDNKVQTVRIGNKAGVPSVPNVLAQVRSYDEFRRVSARLGTDIVVQTAFGDSGHTTYFISSERDWEKHEEEIAGAGKVKIMKRIRCRQAAIEACTTRSGTVVGPVMTEIVGFKELTPYKGGWAGNEILPDAFPAVIAEQAREYTFKFGEELRKQGYRGYFELDFLIDEDTQEVWLGELNPRVTGASSLTNIAAFAFADMPLFLFHLLEFSGQDFNIDITDVNERWSNPANIDSWSQLVLKHLDDEVGVITKAPQSGIYRMNADGSVEYDRFDLRRSNIDNDTEGFFLRISDSGDYCYEGADLGILVAKGRMMTRGHKLNRKAKQWIAGLRSFYETRPLKASKAKKEAIADQAALKMI